MWLPTMWGRHCKISKNENIMETQIDNEAQQMTKIADTYSNSSFLESGNFKNCGISTSSGMCTFSTIECPADPVSSSLRRILKTGTISAYSGRKAGDL
jgi:hypothetical protein